MKKLLVLALVLAVSTIASATVVWDATYDAGTKTVSIALNADEDIVSFTLGSPSLVSSVAGAFANSDVSAQFDSSSTNDGIAAIGNLYSVTGLTNAGSLATGVLFTVDFTIDGDAPAEIVFTTGSGANYVASGATASTDLGGFTVAVPEPITVALLGLGGLFIRRRK